MALPYLQIQHPHLMGKWAQHQASEISVKWVIDLTFFPFSSTAFTNDLQLHKCLVQLPFKSLNVPPQWQYEYKTKALFRDRLASSHEIYRVVYVLISLLLAPNKRSLKPCVCSSTSSYAKVLSGRAGGTEPTYVETFHLQRKGASVSFGLDGGLREPIWQVTGRDAPRKRLSEADPPELYTFSFPARVFHLLLDSTYIQEKQWKNFF